MRRTRIRPALVYLPLLADPWSALETRGRFSFDPAVFQGNLASPSKPFHTDNYAKLRTPFEPVAEDRTDRKHNGATECCGCRFTQDMREYVLRNLVRESKINMMQGGSCTPSKRPVTGVLAVSRHGTDGRFFVMSADLRRYEPVRENKWQ